jgi:uncharacterized protein DUF1353
MRRRSVIHDYLYVGGWFMRPPFHGCIVAGPRPSRREADDIFDAAMCELEVGPVKRSVPR